MAAAKKKNVYIITPRTDNAYKIPYVKANGKIFPLDRKVILDDNDIAVIKNYKETRAKSNLRINVNKIMDDLRIPQEVANKLAREQERRNFGGGIEFVPMYSVTPV